MLYRYWLICLVFSVGPFARAQQPSIEETSLVHLSQSPQWLRLYQYENKGPGIFKSDILQMHFFLSPKGPKDPLAELKSVILALENPSRIVGVQKNSAYCVFPARRVVIERSLGIKFESRPCPDLQSWIERINSNAVSIVFAGAYPNNPASIMGHSLLRLYNKTEKAPPLLSYALGFLGQTNPTHNRFQYILKGLFGGYLGHYDIEPFYMKVGLYNNSESRDLWEQEIDLSPEQVHLLVLHLWELVHNSAMPYYFLDENCSYRLLTLLEAVHPNWDLSNKTNWPVLPADTIRLLSEAGYLKGPIQYRASLLRKLEAKLGQLPDLELKQYKDSLIKKQSLKKIQDHRVLDALIDYWTFENYQKKTQLSSQEKELMEATLFKRAALSSVTKFTRKQIKLEDKPLPPFLGHKSKLIRLGGSLDPDKQKRALVEFRLGAHSLIQSALGYDSFAAIEYLGLAGYFNPAQNEFDQYHATLARVTSLSPITTTEHRLSWHFNTALSNRDCQFCENSKTDNLNIEGAAGYCLSFFKKDLNLFLMPGLSNHIWNEVHISRLSYLKVRSGLIWKSTHYNFLIQIDKNWYHQLSDWKVDLSAGYSIAKNSGLNLEYKFNPENKNNKHAEVHLAYSHTY